MSKWRKQVDLLVLLIRGLCAVLAEWSLLLYDNVITLQGQSIDAAARLSELSSSPYSLVEFGWEFYGKSLYLSVIWNVRRCSMSVVHSTIHFNFEKVSQKCGSTSFENHNFWMLEMSTKPWCQHCYQEPSSVLKYYFSA